MSARWFKGYGRGGSEEKASGLVPRFFEIMREPITKKRLLALLCVVAAVQMAITKLLVMIVSN